MGASPSSLLRDRPVALAVFLAAITWRVVVSFGIVPAWESGSGTGSFPDHYPALAETLLEQGALGFGDEGATPTTLRGPGFPVWLAAGMVIGGKSAPWLGFWTSLAAAVAAAFVAGCLECRYGRIAAIAGGLIAALHPIPSIISARTMSDEFHAALGWGALAAASIALWSRSSTHPRAWAALSGLLVAWHLLTRSSGALTLVALLALVLFDRPVRWRLLVPILLVGLLPAVAWSARSSRLEGRPVFVQSLIGYNFWLGEGFHRFGAERYTGEHYVERIRLILDEAGLDADTAGTFMWTYLTPEQSAVTETRLQRAAARHVLDAPLSYAGRVVAGIWRFWTQAEGVTRTRQYRFLTFPVLVLGAWGGIQAWRRRDDPDCLARLCVLTIVLHNLAYAAIVAMARNSAQVYPMLAYLVGIGVLDLVQRSKSASAG